jgi:hypothetical protein
MKKGGKGTKGGGGKKGLLIHPWGFDLHGPTQQPAVPGLELFIHRVMDHDRQRVFGLSCMPLAFRL